MSQKLTISATPVRNKIHTGKVRKVEDVPHALWDCIEDLCEGRGKWPLFLHGGVGTGKSCAALCLVDRVADAQFWQMPELATYVQSIKQGREEWYRSGLGGTWTERQWWAHLAQIPLLVLDDVGLREVNSAFQTEILFLALEAREGKPMICTSNLNADGIENSYNDRIRSRMCSGTVYELRGRDRRYHEEDL